MILWKVVFVVALVMFAIMAVWVAIGGYSDVKRLFARLNQSDKDHQP